MKISVIIPIYNKEAYIETCIQSILMQNFEEMEILAVDDGSKDKSGELCDQLAETDSRIRVFHIPNSGVTAARRYGVEQARGEYVMFVDADDLLKDGALNVLFDTIQRENADEVVGTYCTQNGRHQDSGRRGWQEPQNMIIDLLSARIHFCVLWGILYKKEVLEGCLDTPRVVRNGEDIMMQIQCLMKEPKVYFIEDIVYAYTEGLPNDRYLNLDEQRVYDEVLRQTLLPKWDCMKPYFHLHQLKIYEDFLEEKNYGVFDDYYRSLRQNVDRRVPLQDRIILFLPPCMARWIVTFYRKVILAYIRR